MFPFHTTHTRLSTLVPHPSRNPIPNPELKVGVGSGTHIDRKTVQRVTETWSDRGRDSSRERRKDRCPVPLQILPETRHESLVHLYFVVSSLTVPVL